MTTPRISELFIMMPRCLLRCGPQSIRLLVRINTAFSTDGHLFAVGSVVRARVRGVDSSRTAVSDHEGAVAATLRFLPYSVARAAHQGDVTPLLRLSGDFAVPRSLVDEVLAPALRLGAQVYSTDPGLADQDATRKRSAPQSAFALQSSCGDAELGTVETALSTSSVEVVSLHEALARELSHRSGETASGLSPAQELSREGQSLDVTELPLPSASAPQILAPYGAKPALSQLDSDLLWCVARGDLASLRNMSADPEVDFRAVHPEHGASVMHLAATALDGEEDQDAASDGSPHTLAPRTHPTTTSSSSSSSAPLAATTTAAAQPHKAETRRLELLECLWVDCGDAKDMLNSRACNGSTPLHWAAGAGNVDAVDWLLKKGADPLAATHTWTVDYFSTGSGRLPVHWAAQSGHTNVIDLLLTAAPLGSLFEDEKGLTAFDVAYREATPEADKAAAKLERASVEGWVVLELRHEGGLSRPLRNT